MLRWAINKSSTPTPQQVQGAHASTQSRHNLSIHLQGTTLGKRSRWRRAQQPRIQSIPAAAFKQDTLRHVFNPNPTQAVSHPPPAGPARRPRRRKEGRTVGAASAAFCAATSGNISRSTITPLSTSRSTRTSGVAGRPATQPVAAARRQGLGRGRSRSSAATADPPTA